MDQVTNATFDSNEYAYTTLLCLKSAETNFLWTWNPLTTLIRHDKRRDECPPSQIPNNVLYPRKHALEAYCFMPLARFNSHNHQACTLRIVHQPTRDMVIGLPLEYHQCEQNWPYMLGKGPLRP
jgi:hypothetical protein